MRSAPRITRHVLAGAVDLRRARSSARRRRAPPGGGTPRRSRRCRGCGSNSICSPSASSPAIGLPGMISITLAPITPDSRAKRAREPFGMRGMCSLMMASCTSTPPATRCISLTEPMVKPYSLTGMPCADAERVRGDDADHGLVHEPALLVRDDADEGRHQQQRDQQERVDLGEQARKPAPAAGIRRSSSPSSARSTNSSVPSGWRARYSASKRAARGALLAVEALAQAVDHAPAPAPWRAGARRRPACARRGPSRRAGGRGKRCGSAPSDCERVARGLRDARDRVRAVVGGRQRDVLPGVQVGDQAHRLRQHADAVVQPGARRALAGPAPARRTARAPRPRAQRVAQHRADQARLRLRRPAGARAAWRRRALRRATRRAPIAPEVVAQRRGALTPPP